MDIRRLPSSSLLLARLSMLLADFLFGREKVGANGGSPHINPVWRGDPIITIQPTQSVFEPTSVEAVSQ